MRCTCKRFRDELFRGAVVGEKRLDLAAHFLVTSAGAFQEREPLVGAQIQRFQEEGLHTFPVFNHALLTD